MPKKSKMPKALPTSPFERMSKEKKLEWLTEKWKVHIKNKRVQATEERLEPFLAALEIYNPSKPKSWKGLGTLINLAISTHQKKPLLPACLLQVKAWAKRKTRAQAEESLNEPTQAPAFTEKQLTTFWNLGCLH